MRSNDVADIIGAKLTPIISRTYRAKRPAGATFPYCVYRVESVSDTYPSEELYVNIDLYEAPTASVRAVETLADSIVAELNHKVIIQNKVNLHFELEQRQSVDAQALVEAYMINIRFAVRAYFI